MITNAPPNCSTNLNFLIVFFWTCDIWHMTCYKWHVTHDTWNVTCDTKGWWTLCKSFSSLALTVWELWFLAAPSCSRRLVVRPSVCPSVQELCDKMTLKVPLNEIFLFQNMLQINAFIKVAVLFFQVWLGNLAQLPDIGPWKWIPGLENNHTLKWCFGNFPTL